MIYKLIDNEENVHEVTTDYATVNEIVAVSQHYEV
jgi:uncharacterized protein YerC